VAIKATGIAISIRIILLIIIIISLFTYIIKLTSCSYCKCYTLRCAALRRRVPRPEKNLKHFTGNII